MLKELRKAQKLTLLDVSQELGYKYSSSYRNIEEGKQSLKVEQVRILAKLFKCSEQKILNSSYSK